MHNKKYYVTNTLSKAVIELTEDYKKRIINKEIETFTTDELNYLLDKGIAVDDIIDEIGLLRYRSNIAKNSVEEMEFVVAPTMMCNFACTYCFETPRQGSMSAEVENKVYEFIKRKTSIEANKRVHIIWFGGEPLMYPDIVFRLNKRIYDHCEKEGKKLKADIITNGYFLTKTVIQGLVSAHIGHVQVTLDGDKCVHDKRRVLHDGSGTYNRILSNLSGFSGTDITVTVRMNIDRNNINSISELENDIYSLSNANIECSPAAVERSKKHMTDIDGICFSNADFDDYYCNDCIKKYYNSMKGSDYSVRSFFCEAEHVHSYAIDELGNVYKCWNSLGKDEEIYCTVDDETPNPQIVSHYFARDPYTESDCIECPYIPICAGGCLMQKLLNGGKNFCSDAKYNYIRAVKNEIDIHK